MTAEFAAVAPALVVALALCLGAIQAVVFQLRLADAAAAAARQVGRGEDLGAVLSQVTESMESVTAIERRDAGVVCVRLTAPSPNAAMRALGVTVSARSCALDGGR